MGSTHLWQTAGGDPEEGGPGEGPSVLPPSGGPGEGGDGPPQPPRQQPILRPDETLTPARAGVGFNLIEAPLHENPEIHSDFNLSAVLIRVNTLHPDYVRESGPQERKESYLVRLIAKEMTLYEYPDTAPENLLEKLLDLELAAQRFLDGSPPRRS